MVLTSSGLRVLPLADVGGSLNVREPEEGALTYRDKSEEGWERLGRRVLGNGSVGGGELACGAAGTTSVDGDFKGLKGDDAVSACVVVDD